MAGCKGIASLGNGAAQQALTKLAATGTQQDFLQQMQTRAELYDLLDYAEFEERDREYFGL